MFVTICHYIGLVAYVGCPIVRSIVPHAGVAGSSIASPAWGHTHAEPGGLHLLLCLRPSVCVWGGVVCLFGSIGLDRVGWLVWDLGLCVSKVAV